MSSFTKSHFRIAIGEAAFAAAKRLLRRRFTQEVLILQAGSFATLGLQFATSVAIANLLTAGPFGTYFKARALLDLVNMLGNLALGQALVTRLAAAHARGDGEEASRLMAYFLKVGLTVSLVEATVGLLGGPYLGAVVLDDPEIGSMGRILFVSPLLQVGFNMVVLALQSSRQVGRLTLLENGALAATSLLNFAAVASGGGVSALLCTAAFAPLLSSVAALLLYRSTLPRMAGFPTVVGVAQVALAVPYRRYFAFSALVSLDKNLANLIALAPTLLLGRLASNAEVAYFRVGYNLMSFLSVPLAPISRNLYAKLSEILARQGPGQLGRSLLRVTLASGAISVAATAVTLVASPLILRVYRPEYMAAQPVMYALGLRFALLGFGVGLGPIYQALEAMKLAVVTKVVPAAIMAGAGWVLIGSYHAVGAALTIVLAYMVGDATNAVLVPWMIRRAGSKP